MRLFSGSIPWLGHWPVDVRVLNSITKVRVLTIEASFTYYKYIIATPIVFLGPSSQITSKITTKFLRNEKPNEFEKV